MYNHNDETTYRIDRSWLLLIAVLSFLNLILLPTIHRTLYFSAFIPTLAATYGLYFLEGASKWIAIFGFGLGTVLVYFLSWYFATANYVWMFVGAVFFLIDTGELLYFVSSNGPQTIWVLDIFCHLMILFFLFRGAFDARKHLKKADKPITDSAEDENLTFDLDSEKTMPLAVVTDEKFEAETAQEDGERIQFELSDDDMTDNDTESVAVSDDDDEEMNMEIGFQLDEETLPEEADPVNQLDNTSAIDMVFPFYLDDESDQNEQNNNN